MEIMNRLQVVGLVTAFQLCMVMHYIVAGSGQQRCNNNNMGSMANQEKVDIVFV